MLLLYLHGLLGRHPLVIGALELGIFHVVPDLLVIRQDGLHAHELLDEGFRGQRAA